jgi:hypothetical protein
MAACRHSSGKISLGVRHPVMYAKAARRLGG